VCTLWEFLAPFDLRRALSYSLIGREIEPATKQLISRLTVATFTRVLSTGREEKH
jgi:hypothetical protein